MPADYWREIGAIGTMDDALAHVAALEDGGVGSINVFPGDDLDGAWEQIGRRRRPRNPVNRTPAPNFAEAIRTTAVMIAATEIRHRFCGSDQVHGGHDRCHRNPPPVLRKRSGPRRS